MKNKIITIIILILLIIMVAGIYVWFYFDKKENERIDAEAVTLAEDLTIEFGEKVKVSDFIENLNGTLVNDYEIDTDRLGSIEVPFEYINIKNKKRNYIFTITTIDKTAPKIFSGGSYTVKVGTNKNLTDVLLSGDDIDDNPKREIIGEYNFNEIGDYNLTYVVTDSSGNKTTKDFVLHVVSDIEKPKANSKSVEFNDVISNYKSDNTKIGIDVSKWQGAINWEDVKNSGVEFVIIRVRIPNGL